MNETMWWVLGLWVFFLVLGLAGIGGSDPDDFDHDFD